jgi:glutamine synthetase
LIKFTDSGGRGTTHGACSRFRQLLENGIGFDGSAVGLKSVKAGDMVLVPELATGMSDPFWEATTLSFICTTLEADTHLVFANDPRNIAIRAEEYLRSTGIADESRWGPEYEFYIFDSVSYEYGVNRASYRVDCQRPIDQRVEWARALHPRAWRLPCHPSKGPVLQPAL